MLIVGRTTMQVVVQDARSMGGGTLHNHADVNTALVGDFVVIAASQQGFINWSEYVPLYSVHYS